MKTGSLLALILFIGIAIIFGGIRYPLALAASLAIHELGHITAAALLKVKLQSVTGSLCGIRMKYDFSHISPIREIIICLAGSFFGLVSAIAAIMLGAASSDGGIYFILSSLVLSAVNMLPVRGLDGGTIFLCILESHLLPDSAWRISVRVSHIIAAVFWLFSIWIQLKIGVNLSMLILSVYFLFYSSFANEG